MVEGKQVAEIETGWFCLKKPASWSSKLCVPSLTNPVESDDPNSQQRVLQLGALGVLGVLGILGAVGVAAENVLKPPLPGTWLWQTRRQRNSLRIFLLHCVQLHGHDLIVPDLRTHMSDCPVAALVGPGSTRFFLPASWLGQCSFLPFSFRKALSLCCLQ
ncbi:hypothetical protein H920_05630 [Fukomys damarensis]|uniref:Uncharacterized protein n=1 Tax=Fukomys damarensis TaxID=885580 RepID=A0A091DLL0_FUKDA|nr:hypothetical protein H920_05630 [Fukomys damarensis]